MPESSPIGGVGVSQTKRTWKSLLAEEAAYKRLVGMMSVWGVGGVAQEKTSKLEDRTQRRSQH